MTKERTIANEFVSAAEREKLINILTDELPVLRAKLGISQNEVGTIIGVSRQTYSAIETKKRPMTWNTFLALILFFDRNEKTKPILASIGAFPESLEQMLRTDRREDNSLIEE
ncbi:MAG: helix-turn-helix transcriptional regulator [Blautia sp.]|nr:helix-turn-helix transcriptional regulator [Blautia sp.]